MNLDSHPHPNAQCTHPPPPPLVPIPRRIILRTNHQTPPLLRPPINRLNDINQLLLILQHPVQLVVVSRPKITHHVLVAEEEHHRARIVQLVHGLEVGHLVQVAEVDDLFGKSGNRKSVCHPFWGGWI